MNSSNVTDLERLDAVNRPYHGWWVVAAAFLIAVFSWGLGFYGPGIYLVALQEGHGWSTAEISSAITVYYLLGATLVFFASGLFERAGARTVVLTGSVALAAGVVLLTLIEQAWEIYLAFAVMSVGWAAMSGAAVNIIIAPWFERRRGLAVSLALNGASIGGVLIAPLLIFAIGRIGFDLALPLVAGGLLLLLLPVIAVALRGKRSGESDHRDREAHATQSTESAAVSPPAWRLAVTLRDPIFQAISVPFALGLTAQVGFLTHQVAYLSSALGTAAVGGAVSLTTAAAVAGRLATGTFVDRVNRRAVAAGNFAIQITALILLLSSRGAVTLYLGCLLFGLGVGNMVSLPSLIIQQEFPREHFARLVSLVVAINQFTFAFGPALLGYLQRSEGGYGAALLACLGMDLLGAIIVVVPLLMRRNG